MSAPAFTKRLVFILLSIVVLVGVFVGGIVLGYQNRPEVTQVTGLLHHEDDKPGDVDFAPFWKAWQILDQEFVDTTGTSTPGTTTPKLTDSQKRVWGAISGLVSSLGDPYTTFFPPQENKTFQQEISGNFGGVGMELGIREGVLVVVAPLKGTPAGNAGILSGDKIIEVDDQVVATMGVQEAINLIRGDVGTKVKITVARGAKNERHDYTLTRAVIAVPTVETVQLPHDIFEIRIYNFGATSADLFRSALREFVDNGSDKLIIDLRGNPGGYLDAAIDMASWFLPAGDTVVVEDHGGSQEPKIYRSKGYDIFNDKLKMVILIDAGSASASEILAGALHEHGRATLVGTKSFGKGSVQELVPLTSDTSIKVTIARWLTPNGLSISHNGLTPDVAVDQEAGKIDTKEDKQLQKAEEVLLQMKR